MDTRAFLTPAQAADPAQASFDHDLLYQFKIDTDGDALEDKVIQVSFTGEGADQQVGGPRADGSAGRGAMENEIADATPAVTGALNTALGSRPACRCSRVRGTIRSSSTSRRRSASCPTVVRSAARSPAPAPSRRASRDAVLLPEPRASTTSNGFNVNSIVIELPTRMLEGSAPGRLGIWGTISQ